MKTLDMVIEEVKQMDMRELRHFASKRGLRIGPAVKMKELSKILIDDLVANPPNDPNEAIEAEVSQNLIEVPEARKADPDVIVRNPEKNEGTQSRQPNTSLSSVSEVFVTVKVRKSIPKHCISGKWFEVRLKKNQPFQMVRIPESVAKNWEEAGYL